MSDVNSAKTASTKTFVTALVFNSAIFGIEIVAFTVLRRYFRAIYEPKSYMSPEGKRVPTLGQSLFTWPLSIWNADDNDIKRVNGLDAYFFVRFLRMMTIMFLPIWLISWPVLLPLTSVNNSAGLLGLDRFTFGNISTNHTTRYAAHVVLTWLFTFWVWYLLRREMNNFVTIRQQFLISPDYASSAQANTILVTGVPRRYLTEKAISKLYSHLPGGVRKVWLNRNLKEMPELYNQRLAACNKLESAETSLLDVATKLRTEKLEKELKVTKKSGKLTGKDIPSTHESNVDGRPSTTISTTHTDFDAERDLALVDRLVPLNKRPTHRLPVGFLPFSLPLIGKKVDSIDWAKQEIRTTSATLTRSQRVLAREVSDMTRSSIYSDMPLKELSAELDKQSYPPLNSAFVLFNKQIAAHMAAQALAHHEPYQMASKYIDVTPEDVIWDNLSMNPYEARIRTAISYLATAGLIICWAIPVAFIGVISNVTRLCATYSWLKWLCGLPPAVTGIISGVLPPVMLAVLMALLPIVLRLLARFEGIPKKTGLELSLMTRYFIFQVIHSFLIVSLSSGIIAALPSLSNNPSSAATLLAQNLPQASTFFLSYIILQGLSGTGAGFLQIVALIIYYVKLFLLGSTPRSIYDIKFGMRSVQWGTLFPSTTLLVVIALAYSVISPIINGLACATFFLFYMCWKYLFLWQLDQPASGETGGLFFPKAIQHVFVGMYVQQICLAALFFLARDQHNKPSAVIEGAMMIVLIVFTAGYQKMVNESYGPLLYSLPLSLADKTYSVSEPEAASPTEKRGLLDQIGTTSESGAGKRQEISGSREAIVGEVEDEEHFTLDGPKEFNHPASVEPQRPIWIPRDALGLAQAEIEDLKKSDITALTTNSTMNEKGIVDVQGPPSDSSEYA